MVIGARLTYTDPPTPVLVLKGVRAPPWHTPCTFAPESNQILAISSLPLLRPLSLSLSLRDLPPTLAGKRCPFECTIPLPATIYRAEDIMGLGFQGKRKLGHKEIRCVSAPSHLFAVQYLYVFEITNGWIIMIMMIIII